MSAPTPSSRRRIWQGPQRLGGSGETAAPGNPCSPGWQVGLWGDNTQPGPILPLHNPRQPCSPGSVQGREGLGIGAQGRQRSPRVQAQGAAGLPCGSLQPLLQPLDPLLSPSKAPRNQQPSPLHTANTGRQVDLILQRRRKAPPTSAYSSSDSSEAGLNQKVRVCSLQ